MHAVQHAGRRPTPGPCRAYGSPCGSRAPPCRAARPRHSPRPPHGALRARRGGCADAAAAVRWGPFGHGARSLSAVAPAWFAWHEMCIQSLQCLLQTVTHTLSRQEGSAASPGSLLIECRHEAASLSRCKRLPCVGGAPPIILGCRHNGVLIVVGPKDVQRREGVPIVCLGGAPSIPGQRRALLPS